MPTQVRFPVFLRALFVFMVFAMVGATIVPQRGGAPSKRSGAPDDGDGTEGNSGTCADVGCHNSFAINSGGGSISLQAPTAYAPGDTITITVRVEQASASVFGFQITARDASGSPTGTWIADADARITIGNPYYLTHAHADATHEWNVRWVAPSADAGDVIFYAAGNASNGNFNASGDYVYTTQTPVALSAYSDFPSSEGVDSPSWVRVDDVYPNPARHVVTIRYTSRQPAHVAVYDMEGRLRASDSTTLPVPEGAEVAFQVDDLPAGVYIARVNSGGRSASRPFVVVH